MYLAELDLHGFKSFAQKTTIRFDDGITAIVGPNGCGKSNIVDALRWVLGEQRPSLLRSAAMTNVIFNGTKTRKALGMSEVSVTIHNNKGILPLEYTDVTITRRLYRNGDSEYLLNKTPCRLKDIIDLFMDTGMGSNAYSVIELKMVEDILSDKNHDRRRLFEEAAGVTKYKDKRKQTLKKLDETLIDMTRIDDILIEIRKNVSSLHRQSNRAKQAKDLEQELHVLDQSVSRLEYHRLQEQLTPLKQRLLAVESEKDQLQRSIEEAEQSRTLAEQQLMEKEQRLNEAIKALTAVDGQLQNTKTSLQIAKERIESEEKNIRQFELDIYAGEEEIQSHRLDIKDYEMQRDTLAAELTAMDATLEQAQLQFNALDSEVIQARQQLDLVQGSFTKASTRLSELQNNRIRLESRQESGQEERFRIHQQREQVELELSRISKESEQLQEELKIAKGVFERAEMEYEDAIERRESLVQETNKLKDLLRTQQGLLQGLEREVELLQHIAQSQEHFPESVQFLLTHKKEFSFCAVVTDLLSTSSDYSVALESVLGEACNYVVLGSREDVDRATQLLKEAKKGKATLIPAYRLPESSEVHPQSIAHHVKTESRWNALKQLLLGQILLVDEGAEPELGFTGVTVQGEVITRETFVRTGSANSSTGIRTSLSDKIVRLEQQIISHQDTFDKKQTELKKREQELNALDLSVLSTGVRQAEQQVRKIESLKSALQARIQMQQNSLLDMNKRLEQIDRDQEQLDKDLIEFQPEARQIEEELASLHETVSKQKDILETIEQNRNRAQSRLNEVQLQHQNQKNKVDAIVREIQRSNEQIEAVKTRVQQRAETAKVAKDLILRYRDEVEEATLSLDMLKHDQQMATQQRDQVEEECMRERGRIRSIDESLKTMRNNRDQSIELLHELGLAKNQLELDARHIADQIFENYGLLMDTLQAELPEGMSVADAKTRLIDVRQRIKNIGEVNPLAIEEYDREVERLSTFETQMEDLRQADAKLRQTIKEINDTAQERFLTTFSLIRDNFKKVFSTLFNEDDECDLILDEDQEDPLESKIEIIAKPRGKRPSAISQLSGGEKTLTAIALLFAIYLVKPSPFCILDEVDAPLDDANIDRFAKILQKFSTETQFIIITHNKLTMEKARMMYGVTMPETGVSKLVAVKLDEVNA